MNSIQKALGLTLMSTLMFSCSNNDDLGSATTQYKLMESSKLLTGAIKT